MKTIKQTGLSLVLLLLFISCKKENTLIPSVTPSPASTASTTSVNDPSGFYLGQRYGGGIIFYIEKSGKHGLIAAPQDQGDNSGQAAWWNGTYIVTGASGTIIGSGENNTRKIIKSQGIQGNYAAVLCAEYEGGGYHRWYLPSKDELDQLYKEKNLVGGFADNFYWSSSEFNDVFAGSQDFVSGFQVADSKEFTGNNVRAIRSF